MPDVRSFLPPSSWGDHVLATEYDTCGEAIPTMSKVCFLCHLWERSRQRLYQICQRMRKKQIIISLCSCICFVEEYLALNGYKGKNKKLVFSREIGKVGNNNFQCRAGKRRSLGNLKNQNICRFKFRISTKKINALMRCAQLAYLGALSQRNTCQLFAPTAWSTLQCQIPFLVEAKQAFINCITPHGLPAAVAASALLLNDPLNCPFLRRDSWIGQCKAPDFVQLAVLGLIDLNSANYKPLLPGACTYK